MAKYSDNLKDKIVDLVKTEFLSINQICQQLSISRNTFYRWKENNTDFAKALDTAYEEQDTNLYRLACQSVKTKLQNYSLTETKLKYIPDINNPEKLMLKEKVVKIKEYAPNTSTLKLIFDKTKQANKKQLSLKSKIGKISPLMLHIQKQNK